MIVAKRMNENNDCMNRIKSLMNKRASLNKEFVTIQRSATYATMIKNLNTVLINFIILATARSR